MELTLFASIHHRMWYVLLFFAYEAEHHARARATRITIEKFLTAHSCSSLVLFFFHRARTVYLFITVHCLFIFRIWWESGSPCACNCVCLCVYDSVVHIVYAARLRNERVTLARARIFAQDHKACHKTKAKQKSFCRKKSKRKQLNANAYNRRTLVWVNRARWTAISIRAAYNTRNAMQSQTHWSKEIDPLTSERRETQTNKQKKIWHEGEERAEFLLSLLKNSMFNRSELTVAVQHGHASRLHILSPLLIILLLEFIHCARISLCNFCDA